MLNYVLTNEQFDLPDGFGLFETSPDGRLVIIGVDSIKIEDSPGSRSFSDSNAPAFGAPAFFRLSPSGNKAAAGNYQQNKVYLFDFPFTSGGNVTEASISSYDAEWHDEEWLAVSGSGAGQTTIVSLVNSTNGEVRPVIDQIPGASGGVSFDADANLYTGIGFAGVDDPATGLIKAFSKDEPVIQSGHWGPVIGANDPPLNFVQSGREVVNLLPAAFLTFDSEDNLCVGGGWGTGPSGQPDRGYAAVVSSNALRRSLFDQPALQPNASSYMLQKLDPIHGCLDSRILMVFEDGAGALGGAARGARDSLNNSASEIMERTGQGGPPAPIPTKCFGLIRTG